MEDEQVSQLEEATQDEVKEAIEALESDEQTE